MSAKRGYIAVSRDFFDHPIFKPEPYTEREAFQWLIKEAAWEARRVRRGRATLDLERGQVAHSLRFMAKAWQWSEPKVRRFLKKLKTDAMVTLETTQESTRITICNYDKYQNPRRTDDADSDAQTDALATHSRRKQEPLNHLTNSLSGASAPHAEQFEAFWKAYPRRDGSNPKEPARKKFIAAVRAGADPNAIIEGARRCAVVDRAKVGTPYIPQAVKWLNDKRWLDYGPPKAVDVTDDQWRLRFQTYKTTGQWITERWGDSPETGRCKAPPHILAEFKQERLHA